MPHDNSSMFNEYNQWRSIPGQPFSSLFCWKTLGIFINRSPQVLCSIIDHVFGEYVHILKDEIFPNTVIVINDIAGASIYKYSYDHCNSQKMDLHLVLPHNSYLAETNDHFSPPLLRWRWRDLGAFRIAAKNSWGVCRISREVIPHQIIMTITPISMNPDAANLRTTHRSPIEW